MKKMLSLISLTLLLPCFSPVNSLAEAAGVAGTAVAPVAPAPESPPPAEDPAAVQKREEELKTFHENLQEHPEIALGALVRGLQGRKAEEVRLFTDINCHTIAKGLRGLSNMVRSGRLSGDDYRRISSELGPFEIRLPAHHRLHHRPAGPPGRRLGPWPAEGDHPRSGAARGGRRPVNDLVEIFYAIDSENIEEAHGKVRRFSRNYPDNPSAQAAAATYYHETGDHFMAEKTATSAIKLDEKNQDAYKIRALARASLEDRKGALEDIKKAMSIDPQDESAKILSILLESSKNSPSLNSLASAEEMKKALGQTGGADAGVVVGVAGVAGAPGTPPAQAGGADHAKSKAYLQTAFSKTRLGDYGEAVRYAGLSIERNPANLDAYLERANAMNFLGRYDDAVRDSTFVLQHDPSNLQALNMRAWALNKKGLSGEAEADSSRAIDINPGYADAWFNRALAYESRGDYKKTLENLRQAAALNGAYQGRYQDAVAQYSSMASGAGRAAYEALRPEKGSPLRRFLILLFFTLSGGALVALGLVHIITARTAKGVVSARRTHPDMLSPSVFYEGVATGKYKIERKIGEGGMGVVYEAVDQSLGRKVAIKKMNDEIKVNDREKQRFLEEARTVALLRHPNIMEIYTIFEEEDNVYLVFEYISGLTLDRLLDREARLGFEKAARIFDGVSKALVYAHSKNIIHRDLKLANIMLSDENEAKVMDFGLASHAREFQSVVSNKEVVGSPAYMAPEQELGVSSREADIYSLGVCLYEALSGALPFHGPDFRYQKEHMHYQRLSAVVPGSPKALDDLISKALDPDPGNRFHNAEEFRRSLLEIAEANGFTPEHSQAGQDPQYKTFPT